MAKNDFFDGIERFCSIPAGSHSNVALCIKSYFVSIFQLIDGNKSQLGIVYQIEKCIKDSLDQISKYVTIFLGF